MASRRDSSTLAHSTPGFAALAARIEAPMRAARRARRRQNDRENENEVDLRFDLFCHAGRRKGARPRREEWIYRARLRGNVIKIEKFSFIPNWCWCTCVRNNNNFIGGKKKLDASLQLSLTNGASANASPSIQASKQTERNNEESEQPLLLLPPLSSVVPESVYKKLNAKKRLHSDASMALATLQEEAVRALVELRSEDKEADLRHMTGGYRRLRRIPRKQAIETNPSITRGVFPGGRSKGSSTSNILSLNKAALRPLVCGIESRVSSTGCV